MGYLVGKVPLRLMMAILLDHQALMLDAWDDYGGHPSPAAASCWPAGEWASGQRLPTFHPTPW